MLKNLKNVKKEVVESLFFQERKNMFFNWFKKENKINNQREELLKEAQKNEDRLDPCLPKKTLPKSGVVK
ncbi:hypothetical protein [uncultured Streptococcus sp.]|uniref:hypothetical protein n=1 Tax=uncultured Streptococcus sp. TaxID=83427 RepID=UPI0028D5FE9A|nr:hypothetical protein [uncultured Streptococcus sp.]